jgi:hypothetical protein
VRQLLCADVDGFSLHAALRVEANDHQRTEQLCVDINRPIIKTALDNLQSTL